MAPIVVYIAGYGRSGSTLLDVMLGSVPGVLGAGELGRSRRLLEDSSTVCSCGEPVATCPVWSGMPQDPDDETMLAYLQRSSGCDIVVDSTKTARGTRERPLALARADFDVRVIHLVRDPAAVAVARKRAPGHPPDDERFRSVGGLHAIVGWIVANIAAERAARNATRAVRLRYEDLVTDPQPAIATLEAGLDVDLGELKRKVAAGEALDPGHALWGNRMRWNGTLHLERRAQAGRWPAATRAVAALAWPLARRYGYNLP